MVRQGVFLSDDFRFDDYWLSYQIRASRFANLCGSGCVQALRMISLFPNSSRFSDGFIRLCFSLFNTFNSICFVLKNSDLFVRNTIKTSSGQALECFDFLFRSTWEGPVEHPSYMDALIEAGKVGMHTGMTAAGSVLIFRSVDMQWLAIGPRTTHSQRPIHSTFGSILTN